MAEYITTEVVVVGLVLSAIGIFVNTTRQTLSGGRFIAWTAATVLIAFVMAIGVQHLLK